jgi:uncharacterized protein (DUF3820 family)
MTLDLPNDYLAFFMHHEFRPENLGVRQAAFSFH